MNAFKIEKTAFLTLAAALAGAATVAACQTNNGDEEGTSGGSAGTSMTSGGSGHGGSSAAGGSDEAGGASSYGGATAEGEAGASGAEAGGASGADAGGAGGASCDDTLGSPACEGVSADCDPYCQAAVNNLKPGVAAAAIACLESDASAYCDSGYSCLTDATAQGCSEDVATDCAAAETTCGEASEGEPACEVLLSAFNDAARAAVVECLESDCYSVYSCAEGMFFE